MNYDTVEKMWQFFNEKVISRLHDPSPSQRDMVMSRETFFAGAASLMQMLAAGKDALALKHEIERHMFEVKLKAANSPKCDTSTNQNRETTT